MALYSISLSLLMLLLLLLLLLLIIIILMISLFHIKQKRTSPPKLPPGPRKLPIIGNLHQLGTLPHRSLWHLSKEYGPLMLLQLGRVPTLVVSSAEAAREVMKTHDLNFCSRPNLRGLNRFSYNLLDIGFAPYGEYWREMKKVTVLEIFSVKRVQSFGTVRAEEVANMITSISESCNTSKSTSISVNMTKELISLTDRITCRVAFGKSYEGKQFNNGRFQENVYEAMAMLGSFAASDFFPYVGRIIDVFTGLDARLEKCFHEFDTFYQQVIDDHLNSGRTTKTSPDQEDVIDVLLRLQKDQTSTVNFTNDNIKAILMNLFLAGVDTSAITMTWTMTELIKKPKVMRKVQEEIRSCVGMKGKIEETDLDQLQYLKMVVKETLRLHPPGVLLIPRESIRHCKINGYDVEPKTRVMVNVWAIGRNPAYWENPDEFFPERFENNTLDYKGQHFEFLPFGAGRRICPAISMAVTMIELALANLLYCFNWELPSEMKEEVTDMSEVAGLTVHKKYALRLVPIKYI